MKPIKFRYKTYIVKISEYGLTGSCTEIFEEYTQKIIGVHFKRKKLLMLSINTGHIAEIEPVSNKMAIWFADKAIAKLNNFNEENKIKIDKI
jgi:hypothetical protein